MEYILIKNDDIKPISEDNDSFVVLNSMPLPGTCYIINDVNGYRIYRYEKWYEQIKQFKGIKVLRSLNSGFGVTEGELLVFFDRMKFIAEAAPHSELQEKFPAIDEKHLIECAIRVIKEAKLFPDDEELAIRILSGCTKRELILSNLFTYEDIKRCESNLINKLRYHCNSEYEKQFIYEKLLSLGSGIVVPLYDNASFCKRYDLDYDFYIKLQNKVLDSQHILSYDDTEKLKLLLNKDIGKLTDEENAFLVENALQIVSYYREEERELYDSISKELISAGVWHFYSIKIICQQKNYNYYKVYESYIKKGLKPSHSIACVLTDN